jgi:hypothetical protein
MQSAPSLLSSKTKPLANDLQPNRIPESSAYLRIRTREEKYQRSIPVNGDFVE